MTRYTYDSLGQLLSEDGPWPDDTVSVSHADPLRTSLNLPVPDSSSWSTGENQLAQLVVTNSTKSEFSYDGRTRRRVRTEYVWQNSAWSQIAEVRYIYDGNVVLQERHYDPRFSLTRAQRVVTYTRGLDLSATLQGAGGIGGLLARTEFIPAMQTSSTAYYHADGNGNITALVDGNQIVVAHYVYDPPKRRSAFSGGRRKDLSFRAAGGGKSRARL